MKPNLLFVNLPNVPMDYIFEHLSSDTFLTLKKSMPLGILYLSSYLKRQHQAGQVGILDYAGSCEEAINYEDIDGFIYSIIQGKIHFRPDLILCSLMFSVSRVFCLRVIENLKKIWPESLYIMGGVHATNETRQLLENKHIDYVFRGEAEISLSQFISQLSAGNTVNIKGVYSKGKIVPNKSMEVGEFIQNLDEIPFPDWDLIDMDMYKRISYITVTGRERGNDHDVFSSVILGTRGCPGRCTFCSQHTTHGRRLRHRSVESIIEEMKTLNSKFRVTTFVPNDDMFLSKKTRNLDLLHAIRDLQIPHLEMQFPNGLHVNSMDRETMDALKNAGTKVVNLAIESGSDYVQKHVVHKFVNLQKAKEVVTYFRKIDVFTRCFFILGFAGETREQMRETIEYAKSLHADWCDFFEAVPLIGSEMYEQYKDMGCISEDECEWSKAYFLGRDFDTPEITAIDLRELAYRANLECNFLNNYNKETGNYEKAISLYKDIIARYPFHIIAWYSMMECYENLENKEKTNEISDKIKEIIKEDNLSLDMFKKYNDLMPKIMCDV